MSDFKVTIERVTIAPHPQADRLELAQVGDYQSIVGKGQFQNGDLVAYIPEQALVPQSLLKELGLEGKLAGKNKNRVKAIKLRGVLSQGICYPPRPEWNEGDDVTEELGIEKYEPPIPASMAGEVYALGQDKTLKYDIENVKRHPDILQDGEEVVFTEKIHGSWTLIGMLPKNLEHENQGRLVVSSKGLSARGLALKLDSEANKKNLYIRVARHLSMEARLQTVFRDNLERDQPVYLLGEVYGKGVQDLAYDAKTDSDIDIGFRIFDIYIGKPGQGRYLNDQELDEFCDRLEVNRVPVLYRGPFSKEIMYEYTNGLETVSGKGLHIREGIVIRPVVERKDNEIGRMQLKSVSENYLTRKGNVTEFN